MLAAILSAEKSLSSAGRSRTLRNEKTGIVPQLRACIGVHGVQALHGFLIQRLATGKGAVFDVFQAVRECHMFQAGTSIERAGRDRFHAWGDRELSQAGAVRKRIVADGCDARGNRECACQAGAVRKRIVADGCDARGNRECACQPLAAVKGAIFDYLQREIGRASCRERVLRLV